MAIKIGITEQGDGGLDLSWAEKMDTVDGAIIITKNLNDNVINKLLMHKDKVIVHCGCTGMGGTAYEPNVPSFDWQLNQLAKLINLGFHANHAVLRIDPIIPTPEGIAYVKNVLDQFHTMQQNGTLPANIRIRISVIDMYPHVRERFTKASLPLPYGNQFYAPFNMMNHLTKTLRQYPYTYETCAERFLNDTIYEKTGCVSAKDAAQLTLDVADVNDINMQNRSGCLCLSCKKELLSSKHPCPHKCAYCYWKD